MKVRTTLKLAAVSIAAIAVSTINVLPAAADSSTGVDATGACGFHITKQSYTNCKNYRDEVIVHYQMWGPGGWMYKNINRCIAANSTKKVSPPPGWLGYGATDLKKKC